MLLVVEESTVPEFVRSAGVVVEEATVASVELVQTVGRVLRRVAVDDVEQDDDPETVRNVDESLQFVRRSKPTAKSNGMRGRNGANHRRKLPKNGRFEATGVILHSSAFTKNQKYRRLTWRRQRSW